MARTDGQIYFDETADYSIVIPETATIRQAVAQEWKAAFYAGAGKPELNTDTTSPAGQLVDAQVAEIEAKNAELVFLASQFNPKVSEGRFQDALGKIYFLERKIEEPTVVKCKVTGTPGTVIPYGAIVQTETDGIQLICNAPVTIDVSGQAEAYFRTAETGAITIAAGSVTKIVTVIAGWASVENATAGETGRDRETASEFEARRYKSVAGNSHGSVSALYGKLASLNGVLACTILENVTNANKTEYGLTMPGHCVAICISGGSDTDIAEAIFLKKDAGCGTTGGLDGAGQETGHEVSFTHPNGTIYKYRICRPTDKTLSVKCIVPSVSSLSTTVIEKIKQAVLNDFLGRSEVSNNARPGPAETIYASRFYVSVMAVEGVVQLDSIVLDFGNTGTFDTKIDIKAVEMPVMSISDITVVSRT